MPVSDDRPTPNNPPALLDDDALADVAGGQGPSRTGPFTKPVSNKASTPGNTLPDGGPLADPGRYPMKIF